MSSHKLGKVYFLVLEDMSGFITLYINRHFAVTADDQDMEMLQSLWIPKQFLVPNDLLWVIAGMLTMPICCPATGFGKCQLCLEQECYP